MQPYTPFVSGAYPGGGKASLLRCNEQVMLIQNQQSFSGASVAVQLERIKSQYYPNGVSMQIWFTDVNGVAANPGAFEVDLQGSDIDADAQYSTNVGLTAVSTNFSGRIELPWIYAKYVRALVASLTNPVFVNVLVTR